MPWYHMCFSNVPLLTNVLHLALHLPICEGQEGGGSCSLVLPTHRGQWQPTVIQHSLGAPHWAKAFSLFIFFNFVKQCWKLSTTFLPIYLSILNMSFFYFWLRCVLLPPWSQLLGFLGVQLACLLRYAICLFRELISGCDPSCGCRPSRIPRSLG